MEKNRIENKQFKNAFTFLREKQVNAFKSISTIKQLILRKVDHKNRFNAEAQKGFKK